MRREITPIESLQLMNGQYFDNINPMIEFDCEIVSETSISPVYEELGMAKNRMHLIVDHPRYGDMIIWEIEYDDGDEDEWQIGLEIDGKRVTGYDGVMCISEHALQLLRLAGYDVSEIE